MSTKEENQPLAAKVASKNEGESQICKGDGGGGDVKPASLTENKSKTKFSIEDLFGDSDDSDDDDGAIESRGKDENSRPSKTDHPVVKTSMEELFGSCSSSDEDDDEENGFDDDSWDAAYKEWEAEQENRWREEERRLEDAEDFARKHPLRRKRVGPINQLWPQPLFFTRFEAFRNSSARLGRGTEGGGPFIRANEEIAALQIERLPCSAKEFFQSQRPRERIEGAEGGKKKSAAQSVQSYHGWSPSLRTVLAGTRSIKKAKTSMGSHAACPLSLLRDYETTIIRNIFSYLRDAHDHVRFTIPADLVGVGAGRWLMRFVAGRQYPNCRQRTVEQRSNLTSSIPPIAAMSAHNDYLDTGGAIATIMSTPNQSNDNSSAEDSAIADAYVAFSKVRNDAIQLFPPPQGRNVNMMPFVLGSKDSLPDHLQCYYDLIDACPWVIEEEGNVAYLTVQETECVEAGETQRRPGLHIESPGVFADSSFLPYSEHPWGNGFLYLMHPYNYDHYEGGIYIASNVDDTTALWDGLVDRSVPGMVDRHGGCEYLRPIFPESRATKLKAGELVWMTDCTVHEALPQPQTGPRTFFRLVMPSVSHWYAAHSTPNPKVPVPETVTVVEGSKFSGS